MTMIYIFFLNHKLFGFLVYRILLIITQAKKYFLFDNLKIKLMLFYWFVTSVHEILDQLSPWVTDKY